MREDLGMVMCLLSYGAGLNEQAKDSDQMTALHFAMSERNLEITRLLLCMGADPNMTDADGQTPRHLAAKLDEVDLLKSLIIGGAQRCPLTKVGCVSDCVNEKHCVAFGCMVLAKKIKKEKSESYFAFFVAVPYSPHRRKKKFFVSKLFCLRGRLKY